MDWPLIPLVKQGVSIIVNEEVHLFIQAAFTGMVLFAFYDVLRIFRRICSHGIVWVSIEDVLYWIFCALYIFSVILKENSGIFRSFFVVGVVLGAALYYIGLSHYLVEPVSKILKKILHIVSKGLKVVFSPIKKVVIFLANRVKECYKKCYKSIKKQKKSIEKT